MDEDLYESSLDLFTRHAIERNCGCSDRQSCLLALDKSLETSMNSGLLGIRLFPIDGLIETLAENIDSKPNEIFGNAADAVRCLCTYGINICRNPLRPEYGLIKTYTGFFQSMIIDKFTEYSLVLTGFGYDRSEYSDELKLGSIPHKVTEFTFDVFLATIELRRIQNLIRIAIELKEQAKDGLHARKSVKKGRKWRYQDAVVYLINSKHTINIVDDINEQPQKHTAQRDNRPPPYSPSYRHHSSEENSYSSEYFEPVKTSHGLMSKSVDSYLQSGDNNSYPSSDVSSVESNTMTQRQHHSSRRLSDAGRRSPLRSPHQQTQNTDDLSFIYDKNFDKIPEIYKK